MSEEVEDHWRKLPEVADLPYDGVLRRNGLNRTIFLRIETVNSCNNYCIVCAYRDQQRPKTFMQPELFKKAVSDYCDLGGGYLSLTPLVGDVLLDRHLISRLEFLESQPLITGLGVTTNASMAHRFEDAELRYITSCFGRLSISIYGVDPLEYETMTKRRTYDAMLEGIRRIVDFSPAPVSLEFRLLNKKTVATLEEWVRDEVRPRPRETPNYAINSVITDYANWGVYDGVNTPLSGDAKWFASAREERRRQCMIPILACMIFSNGNVSFCPCDNFNDVQELRIGNIAEQSLAEIYNSSRVRELWDWEGSGTPDFCKGCSFHIDTALLKERPSILTDPHQLVGAG